MGALPSTGWNARRVFRKVGARKADIARSDDATRHRSGLRLGGYGSCGPCPEFLPLLGAPTVQILNRSAAAFDQRSTSVYRDAFAVDEAGIFRHQIGAE